MPETVIAGRYRLDELLGRGGMSEVWRAEDLELGRDVAIKLLAPDADTARFEREARAVASLAHPNITQLFDYGEEDGRPFMVLECVPGGTLEDRLGTGKPLPDDEALTVAAGLAAGLAHAHARGVVHRDLKPSNVLFDEEGRPKLADFGIARMAVGEGTLTEAGTVLGTAAYISPEQALGEKATAASDVYSWGVIVYRLLTGRLPFESSDPLELVQLHRDAPPPPVAQFRDDAPARLESAATAALSKSPSDRPRDGGALLAELGVPATTTVTTAAAGLEATQVLPVGATAPPTGDAYPPPVPARRRRGAILATAFGLLALAGAALAYEVTRPSSSPDNTPSFTATTLPTTGTTTDPTTAPPPPTTEQTTTEQTTSQQTTRQRQTQPTTTAPPPPPPTTEPTTTADTTTPATTTTTTSASPPGPPTTPGEGG